MVGSIKHLAEAIKLDLIEALPHQRKTQRDKLALLVATMLHARSANTMDLAAYLPIKTQRIDMRYQWIARFLSNDLVYPKEVLRPFIKQILKDHVKGTIILTIDQTRASKQMQILMISICYGKRALPLAWKVKKTQGTLGFEDQKQLLDQLSYLLPKDRKVVLMGDRFYGTAALIEYCHQKKWDYRLRLKSKLFITKDFKEIKIKDLKQPFIENVTLTGLYTPTNIAIVHEKPHEESWIIAMSQKPDIYKALDYSMRWSIEPMFSDFKTRGFGLENTQLRYPDRLEKLLLVMTLAMIWAIFSGLWDALAHPLPYEKANCTLKKPIAA